MSGCTRKIRGQGASKKCQNVIIVPKVVGEADFLARPAAATKSEALNPKS